MKRTTPDELQEFSQANLREYENDIDINALRYAYKKYNDRNRSFIQNALNTTGELVSAGGALSTVFGFPTMLVSPFTGATMVGGGIGAYAAGRAISDLAEPPAYKALYDKAWSRHIDKRHTARSKLLRNPDFIKDVTEQYANAETSWRKSNPGKQPSYDDALDFYYDIDYPALFKKYNYPVNIPLSTKIPESLRDDYDAYSKKHTLGR